MFAIGLDRPGIARTLLTAGADPNARHPDGTTALMAAADAGMVHVEEALLARGADVTAAKADGSTALHGPRTISVHGAPVPRDLQPEIRIMLERARRR